MGILDGQNVDALASNAAWLAANKDDAAIGKIGLANTDVGVSGAVVANIQALLNANRLTIGSDETDFDIGRDYNAVLNTIINGDTHKTALVDLAAKFHPSTGHTHDGTNGNGGPVPAGSIGTVPLRGFTTLGATLIGVTGSSHDVSTELSGKSPSTSPSILGVVVNAPNNKIIIQQGSGTNVGDQIVDADGNEVFGRLTEAASVWTLSLLVNVGGVESAHTLGGATDIKWFYQELFNPLSGSAPVYSEHTNIHSDNATEDVITATETAQGKTQLASSAAADVGSAGSKGTSNATVANADHVHKGIRSIKKSGDSDIHGDATLSEGSGITLNQVGNNIQINAAGLTRRADREAIGDLADSIAIVFSSTIGTTDYAVQVVIENTTDANPQFLIAIVTVRTATGFTVKFNAPTDSANYVLHYFATPVI